MAKLKLGGSKTESKPQTDLKEKVSGHKFQLPKKKEPSPAPTEVRDQRKPTGGIRIGNKSNTSNGEKVSTATRDSEPVKAKATEGQTAKANPVPDISNERFNIVDGSDPELTQEAANDFREMIAMLQDCIDDDPHSLQNVLRKTMEQLGENPALSKILAPEDRAVFVRAARASYGITTASKQANKQKSTRSSQKVEALMDELSDLDFAL